jgi:hypothetical protein
VRLKTSIIAATIVTSFACASSEKLAAEEIVILDWNDPVRQAECADNKPAEYRKCMFREANGLWAIEIWEGPPMPRSNESPVMIPDALTVLQGIVDQCELVSTYYVRATDGVAFLRVGQPDLDEQQIDCIRTFEEPGLRLRKN